MFKRHFRNMNSNMSSIASPLGSIIFLTMSFDYVYSTRHGFLPMKQPSNTIKKAAGYPHNRSCHCYTSAHNLPDTLYILV